MPKQKVIRFRVYDRTGNPHDLMIGHPNVMGEYDDKITDIYYEYVDYGDHGADYVVAVYSKTIQRFAAKNLEYFELEHHPQDKE